MSKAFGKNTGAKKEGSGLLYDLKHNKFLLLMLLPGILFFVVFAYLPMIGIVIAFQDFSAAKGILGSKFVGFENFRFFLGSPDSFRVTFNTLFLNVLFILSSMVVSILIALMLSEVNNKWFKKGTQSLVILPHFISWAVIGLLAEAFLSSDTGFINRTLQSMGLEQISFYKDAAIWPGILTFLNIWQGAGFGSIVYLAAITGIDQEIYEAARIDGSTKLQSIWYITLPLLRSTAVLLLIMSVGKIFNGNFGMIYALVGGNTLLYPTTDIIDTYVYRQLMELGDLGMSSAVGLYQSVLGFIMVNIANWVTRKLSPDSAIF
ncbi:MAG: sugar ABC transporter permease [Lachnospiraceae bacterium]|nr:sugar ABC transporter permease [Lachnospiraceae bacterium]